MLITSQLINHKLYLNRIRISDRTLYMICDLCMWERLQIGIFLICSYLPRTCYTIQGAEKLCKGCYVMRISIRKLTLSSYGGVFSSRFHTTNDKKFALT